MVSPLLYDYTVWHTITHSFSFFDMLLLCSSGQPTTHHEGQTCFSVIEIIPPLPPASGNCRYIPLYPDKYIFLIRK